jgi:hypothetical protein
MAQPDFSGTWRFRAHESALEITRPDVVKLLISHDGPFFRLERTLVFGDRTDTFAIDLCIGVEPRPFARGAATLYPSLQWDGDQLVFRTRIVRPEEEEEEEATNVVRYRLAAEGAVLVADEHFESATQRYDNRWVFEKDGGGGQTAAA